MEAIGLSFYSDPDSILLNPVVMGDIEDIKLSNAKFDIVYSSLDTDLEQYNERPDMWITDDGSDVTVFLCDFNGKCDADDTEFSAVTIKRIIVQKREKKVGEMAKDLFAKDITKADDFKFSFIDRLCSANKTYEYSLLAESAIGERTELHINEEDCVVKSAFDGIYILDSKLDEFGEEQYYGTQLNISLDFNRNTQQTLVNTISGKYPYICHNSANNYVTGGISGLFLKMINNEFDLQSSAEYRDDFYNSLTNGYPKFIKLYNGRSYFASIGTQITEQEMGYLLATTSFEFTEIGDVTDAFVFIHDTNDASNYISSITDSMLSDTDMLIINSGDASGETLGDEDTVVINSGNAS